ncbi:MAG: 23S rRNA (pseudouridine(1915)-N(3))-methyltransferase RlmH [Alphaproteobacteria bacterium]
MHLQIRAIGRLKKNTPEYVLIADYIKKTRWPIEVKEYEEKKSLTGDQLKQAEAKLLLKDLPVGAYVVALDEHGQTLSSRELAGILRPHADKPLIFIIGGADGLDESVRQRANLILSFGRMTLPHFLMRVVLSEQIYRMRTLWDNHPYHRD